MVAARADWSARLTQMTRTVRPDDYSLWRIEIRNDLERELWQNIMVITFFSDFKTQEYSRPAASPLFATGAFLDTEPAFDIENRLSNKQNIIFFKLLFWWPSSFGKCRFAMTLHSGTVSPPMDDRLSTDTVFVDAQFASTILAF
jgi:hypothetical protein